MWGRTIGAVAMVPGSDVAAFQYDPAFARSGVLVSPLTMPPSDRVYSFPELPRPAFKGLPGLIADVLPDKFGNALIDAWLARQGRAPETFTAVDRLCYIGSRGIGALEFEPSTGPDVGPSERLDVEALVALASDVLSARGAVRGALDPSHRTDALTDILRVGTSAGGARAKALIAWNPHTHEVRSGQVEHGSGFEPWLIKFDGVTDNRDKELADPVGYGAVELAYHHMAVAAGVQMSECRLLEEGGRRHFLTRRFDRTAQGRLHMQSLAALAHLDFNAAGAHGYEQALTTIRRLGLGMDALEEQVRRMLFNVVARNQDDHVKNIAFLMDRQGAWSLSPAFDVTWAYNPQGAWTQQHQMSLNGKRDGFVLDDLRAVARGAALKRGRVDELLDEVVAAVSRWPAFAHDARVTSAWIDSIAATHRLRWR
jgi:serine/threonine-protein kinase HipA